jgi:hypothetical protein
MSHHIVELEQNSSQLFTYNFSSFEFDGNSLRLFERGPATLLTIGRLRGVILLYAGSYEEYHTISLDIDADLRGLTGFM